MVSSGINIDAKSYNGYTALMRSAMNDHPKIGFWLIQNGCNLNIKDNTGMTALMYAAQYGRLALVKELVNNGAITELKNNQGKTALDFASGNNEIINTIRNTRNRYEHNNEKINNMNNNNSNQDEYFINVFLLNFMPKIVYIIFKELFFVLPKQVFWTFHEFYELFFVLPRKILSIFSHLLFLSIFGAILFLIFRFSLKTQPVTRPSYSNIIHPTTAAIVESSIVSAPPIYEFEESRNIIYTQAAIDVHAVPIQDVHTDSTKIVQVLKNRKNISSSEKK